MMKRDCSLLLIRLLFLNIVVAKSMRQVGKAIELQFPNKWDLLGVSGLAYDDDRDIWTCSTENIPGTDVSNQYPETALPRLHKLHLDFTTGEIEIESTVVVKPHEGLKLEDIALAPPSLSEEPEFWLVSEANSNLVKTNQYFTKDFGTPDLSTFDPETFETSRLLRVNRNGTIIEDVEVPDFSQWDGHYDWDALECVGDRPFQGFHAISIVPSLQSSEINGNADEKYTMIVASQAAFYQDGATPTDFEGSAIRFLFFNIHSNNTDSVVTYDRSYRYDSSQLTLSSYQKGARHFNALFSMVAFNETAFLIAECEELSATIDSQTVTNRIFYVELDANATVDHCYSLLDCDIKAPSKRLIWERQNEKKQLDGIAWGPNQTIAIVYENDDKIGTHIELFTLDEDEIKNSPVWTNNNSREEILQSRVTAVWVSVAVVIVLTILQALAVHYVLRKPRSHNKTNNAKKSDASSRFDYKYLCLGLSAMNSFLVGGVTFGYSGMSLMLREEGTYADQCACGSFCSAEKEALALVSTVGFFVAIGSRLFIGLILDVHGPKITSILCNIICLAGFLLLGASSSEALQNTFIWAWILLSLGGSGLHVVGFHMTNNFKGDGKKVASAIISAAFGASSAIFPIWQILNQNAGVSLQSMSLGYSFVVLFLLVANFLMQPWKKVQPGNPLSPDLAIFNSSWWNRGSKKNKPLVISSILELMSRFEFWGECIFYTFNLWLLTYYLSVSGAFLYEKGDIPFTSNPNDPTDYMYSRMAGWMNSLGFLWYPTTKLMMLKVRWPQRFYTVVSANVFVAILVITVPRLVPQVIGMVVLSCSRLMLFSFHHAFLLEKFGIEYFGLLNGLSSFIASLVGLLSYPIQLWAVQIGNYSITFIPVGIAVLFTGLFGFFLRRQRIMNWAKIYGVEPQKIRKPKDVDEVIDLVKNNKEIRCAGSMTSCAPLVKSGGIILDFQHMNKIIDIDLDKAIATVQPGVKIHELCEAVKPHGFALGTLGTIDTQTVIGALMTGTHGVSLCTPSLHDFVVSYSLIMNNGEKMTISREKDPELISAIAPSMGMLGVVVECNIHLIKLQYLEANVDTMAFEEVIPKCKEIMESNQYARILIYPNLDMATVWRANPIKNSEDESAGKRVNKYINFRDEHEKALLERFLVHQKKRNYKKGNALLHQVVENQQRRLKHYEGLYNHVLCNEQNQAISHANIEFGIDFSRADEVLKSIREWFVIEGNHIPYYNFEIRATKKDNAMMSCCFDRDTLYVDFKAKPAEAAPFFKQMEEFLAPYDCRKHWGTGVCNNSDPEYVIKQFPNMKRFMELIDNFDREGKFRNAELRLWFQNIKDHLEKSSETSSNDSE